MTTQSGLTVSTDHYDRVFNYRTDAVVLAALVRPERLYPVQKFTPTRARRYDLSAVPKSQRTFKTIDEALALVREWCG